MRVEIEQGQCVAVGLRDTDGEFLIEYGFNAVTITTEFEDSDGRVGKIYEERYNEKDPDEEEDENAPEHGQVHEDEFEAWCLKEELGDPTSIRCAGMRQAWFGGRFYETSTEPA